MSAPAGTTHVGEFYGRIDYYRLSVGLHYNTVIDHPEECWQRYPLWHVWENGKWVCPGEGFSSRRLQLLQHAAAAV